MRKSVAASSSGGEDAGTIRIGNPAGYKEAWKISPPDTTHTNLFRGLPARVNIP
jgi:hypothetical protein